jgi:hypothetical protein
LDQSHPLSRQWLVNCGHDHAMHSGHFADRGLLDRGGGRPADRGERRSDGSADRGVSVLLNYFTQMMILY